MNSENSMRILSNAWPENLCFCMLEIVAFTMIYLMEIKKIIGPVRLMFELGKCCVQ